MRTFSAALLALLALTTSCGELETTDRRYATPERTIESLLAAYGLEHATQDELRAQLTATGHFELEDRALYEGCFADLETDVDEGLAGWILGAIAAGREDIRVQIAGESATVSPRDGLRIVMRRDDHGAWRFVLRESVPVEVRRSMAAITERYDRRARSQGMQER